MPGFFIIGAARSGTTALYRYLKQHPQIYMSPHKEPRFFAFEGETLDFKGPAGRIINKNTVTDRTAYQELFRDAGQATAIGEASPIYLYSKEAPRRIKETIPEAKLIAILRNPVDRAFSSFLHMAMHGHETVMDFGQALQKEEERIRANWAPLYHYKTRGLYYQQLQQYYELFDASRIRIYLYDDFRVDPAAILKDIFYFLGVQEDFVPDMSHEPNVSGLPKNKALYRIMNTMRGPKSILKSVIKPLLPEKQREKVRSALNSISSRNLARPKVSSDLRHELITFYREDISRLQDLTGRDLSAWLR